MANDNFFDESTEQSQLKQRIVAKYFWAWAKVMTGTRAPRIAYLDLFSGPGRYRDGTESTPLLVLERAIADPDIASRLVTFFNDENAANTQALQSEIDNLPGIRKLKYKPEVHTETIDEKTVEGFKHARLVPTLLFIDPWGYKGVSLELINCVLKNWGCDCIFFFNYNRINPALSNDVVRDRMNALFGVERALRVRHRIEALLPEQRELTIVEELSQALREVGANFVLPFSFRTATGGRTSHYLIFASKNVRGYEIMKEIMAGESSDAEQGVATFEYAPADRIQPLLFELNRPLDDLEDMLVRGFAGQTLPMLQVYEKHHVGKRYIKRNYKQVLLKMEKEGKISANPPAQKRRKGTFSDNVVVTFPRGE